MSQKCTLKDIIKQIKSQKKDFWLTNLYAIVATLMLLPLPMLIPLLIDEMLLKHPAKITSTMQTIGIKEDYQIILIVLLITILLRVGAFYLNTLKTIHATTIIQKINYMLRDRILHHLQRVSMQEYEMLKSGTISSKSIQDVESISSFVSSIVSDALPSLIMLGGVGMILLWMNWQLTIFIFILIPSLLVISKFLGRMNRNELKAKNEAYQSYTEMVHDTIELFSQVRVSNQEKNFFDILKSKAKDIETNNIKFTKKSTIINNTTSLIMQSSIDLLRAFGIIAVLYSNLSIGMMIAFLFYLSNIISPMHKLMGIVISYQKITPAMQRIESIFAMSTEPHYHSIKNPFDNQQTVGLELKDISFSYDGKKDVLQDINIQAKPSQKIALIGPSGGGKSTIAHIIIGLYTPKQGQVLYDGIPIEEIGLTTVRENVSLMLQQALFFNDTIRMNLTLGKDIDDDTIFQALKTSKLYDFVSSLDNSLDTLIGKNGIKLSGGQKQRLAIARVLLSKPKLIIFDESTSALDNQTEYDLYDTLNKHINNITTIIIAHRTTTIKQADYIYIVENGKIKAKGDYNTLKSQNLIKDDFDR
jgi:ATP-binding cassette subfamily C protein